MQQPSTGGVALMTRILLGLALCALLAVTIAAGLGTVLRGRSPELARRVAPWNAQAAGRLSQQLLLGDQRQQDRALRLAEEALRRDPTVVSAIVTVGAINEVRGRGDVALRAFTYAEWLSRRNLPTELWWIEHGVMRGDVAQALRHYDIALRAIKRAPDILFPVLGAAISEIEVRRELVDRLRRNPAWKERFLQWLISNGVNNRAAASLLIDLQGAGRRPSPELFGQLEHHLMEERDYAAAWSLYTRRHGAVRRDGARDKTFAAAASGGNSPFDWNVVSEQGAAAISRMGDRSVLTFTTVPTSADTLARQFELLPAGRYRLRDAAQIEGPADEGRPYWMLHCVDGRELARAPLGAGERGATMVVPRDCPAQWLILAVDAGDAVQGVTGTVREITLLQED